MADFENNDVVRLGCVQKISGVYDLVNTLTCQILAGGPLTFALAVTDFQAYTAAFFSPLATSLSNQLTASRISVANLTQGTVFGSFSWLGYTGGSATSDPTAYQVALLVYGRTSIPRVQIRKYLGLLTEPSLVAGVWGSGIRVLCEASMLYHVDPQTLPGGLQLRGCAYNPTLARVTFATAVASSSAPVIQRRRRQGTGS